MRLYDPDLERRAEGLWIETFLRETGREPVKTWEEVGEPQREKFRQMADSQAWNMEATKS